MMGASERLNIGGGEGAWGASGDAIRQKGTK